MINADTRHASEGASAMEGTFMGKIRLAVMASLILVALALGSFGTTASGTSALGSASTKGLNVGTLGERVQEINSDGVQFKTQQPIDVVQTTTSADPGWSSGWHKHTGPVIISVKSGTLTFYDASCGSKSVGAGQAFVERTGEPLIARNESASDAATWFTTQIIPAGSSRRIDVTPGFCGLP